MDTLKTQIHQACLTSLESKIERLKKEIQDAQDAAAEDTKSSAGDKFETSREMIKLEINKYNTQLAQTEKMYQMLRQLNPASTKSEVSYGSLVISNEGNYYFSVSLGKVVFDGKNAIALSMASPIGKALQGKSKGEIISFMSREIIIEDIQ